MPSALSPAQKRYVLIETLINVGINAAISALFVWLVFRGRERIPLGGAQGLAVDLIPTTFMITLFSTVVLTLLTRKRAREGAVPTLAPAALEGWTRSLPDRLLVRAPLLAGAASLVLVPLTIGVLYVGGLHPMSLGQAFGFKILYGSALAWAVSPLILMRALADRP